MTSPLECPRLVADIGATNARFALAGADGQPYAEQVLAVTDYPDRVRLFFYDVPDLGFPTFCQVRSGQVR